MNPLLEARRRNDEPKCATCGWWQGGDASVGRCDRHDAPTLDFAVCSDWRDRDVVVDVLTPEQND